jgi:hypothetical protein
MATTTNYGWETPDDTDLVKDGASAIRTLGSSIDTTTKALNPETTLGDISYRSSTANTNTRLPIGTSGQVLSVNGSGVPAWITFSSGGMTSIASGSIAASATGIDISSISGTYNNLFLVLRNYSTAATTNISLRFNNNSTGTNYSVVRQYFEGSPTETGSAGTNQALTTFMGTPTQTGQFLMIQIFDYANTSSWKMGSFVGSGQDNAPYQGSLLWRTTSAIDRVQIIADSSTFDTGTYILYGVK